MHREMLAHLQDGLEETILDTTSWPDFLDTVARASGSEGASLMRVEECCSAAIWTPTIAHLGARYFEEGRNRVDHRLKGIPFMRGRG